MESLEKGEESRKLCIGSNMDMGFSETEVFFTGLENLNWLC